MSIDVMKRALEALALIVAVEWVPAFTRKEYDSDEPEENEMRDRVLTAIHALRTAIEQAEKCQRDNPLGGPAKVFDAMANSIRAGDDYHQVLRQYGFVEAAPVQEQFGPQEILQMIVDRALEKSAAQRQWVSLTDEEIDKTHETQVWDARRSYARAIEVKLREKNTGETK